MTDISSAAAPAAPAKTSMKAVISAWFNANIGGSPQFENWEARKHLRAQFDALGAALDGAGTDKAAIEKAVADWVVATILDSPLSRVVRALTHLKESLPDLVARATAVA